jgi:nitroimidazol reductase NimA-like FMN-containing flavoprotein (pyridoxamine 5'-phosphate oxidase superfamily)
MTENGQQELEAMARRVIDSNRYMTIASLDEDGAPWATPVYFCPDGYGRLYWISSPETRHSRNIAKAPDVSIVVFDSSVEIGHAEAVYMRARAEEVAAPTEEDCARAFRPRFQGVKNFGPDELRSPAGLRLYRAAVDQHWVLIRANDPVWGRGKDTRLAVSL